MLKAFEIKYMDSLVDRVLPLWKVDGESLKFNRLYVEMIIRTNMHLNELQFEMTDGDLLKAIAFSAEKKDFLERESSLFSGETDWFLHTLKLLSARQQDIFTNGRKYLLQMEENTFSLMKEGDIKLCLFVSLEKGWGQKILDETFALYRKLGFKRVFLWTDCECNVDWYFTNGFELVSQEEYPPFSKPESKYMTYIFKKNTA